MPGLHRRGSIALAAVLVALLSSRAVDAQVVPCPTRQHGGSLNALVSGSTGVKYDIVNQAMAERHLQIRQAKLRRDAERCRSVAVDRDARRIENLEYRIVVDEWLIRKNSLQDPGCYPHALRLHPISCAAIADAARPAPSPYPSQFAPSQGPRAGEGGASYKLPSMP